MAYLPIDVIRAFGLDPTKAPPAAIDGGQGTSFLVDGAVLKPVDNAEEHDYAMRLQEQLIGAGNTQYRVPQPLVAHDQSNSRYIVDGWAGAKFLDGNNSTHGKWTQMLAVSRAFHADLRPLAHEPPGFIAKRTHRWGRADRLIWDETEAGLIALQAQPVIPAVRPLYQRLLRLRRSLDPRTVQSQLVHGDLTGNFLFSESHPPAIIDLSLYWHPVEYAEAVIAADGILDHGAGMELVNLMGRTPFRLEMLVRAMILRHLTDSESIMSRGNPVEATAFEQRSRRAVEIVERSFRESGLSS